MKNSKRGFIPIVLLIIIVASAIGGGSYYYSQKAPSEEVETNTQATTTQTTEWKTYTNSQYGFSLKYPNTSKKIYTENQTCPVPHGTAGIFSSEFVSVSIGCGDFTEATARVNDTKYNSLFTLEKRIIADRQAYLTSYFTSTDYYNRQAYLPLDNNHFIIVETAQKGLEKITNADWNMILNSVHLPTFFEFQDILKK